MAEPAAVQILRGKSEEQELFRGETEDIRHHDSHHSYVVYGAQSERNQHNQYDQANLKRDKTIFSVRAAPGPRSCRPAGAADRSA